MSINTDIVCDSKEITQKLLKNQEIIVDISSSSVAATILNLRDMNLLSRLKIEKINNEIAKIWLSPEK